MGGGGAFPPARAAYSSGCLWPLAFLKTAQKFDAYLAAMGLNVAQTGSSMGMELLMAARVISGVASGGARQQAAYSAGQAAHREQQALRQAADFLQGLQAALSRIPMCAMLW